MLNKLRELEARLRKISGAWNHYNLRLWLQCRSAESAGVEDRIKIAKEILAYPHRGEWIWALGGWHMLIAEIKLKLNDPDPHVRQDAAIALGDLGPAARIAVPILLDCLRSPDETLHDRACAAWALPRIGVAGEQAVPVLLQVLDETANQADADELRCRAAHAVEALTDSLLILVPLARRCLSDRGWRSRLYGLALAERLGDRSRRLLKILAPSIQPLLKDEVDEIREHAREVVDRIAGGELQN